MPKHIRNVPIFLSVYMRTICVYFSSKSSKSWSSTHYLNNTMRSLEAATAPLAVFTGHNCCAYNCQGGGGECLHALAGIKIPASAQITFKFFLKTGIPCTYLFFKHMPRSFAPKQRRQFEIFRKGDGLSLVHLLGIKAVYTLKS